MKRQEENGMKNQELMAQACADIYQTTGIKPVIYDADMHMLYAHPLSMSPFCTAIRQIPGCKEKCLACDREGFSRCRESGDICIYQCHMGLTEAAAPILDSGVVIGYLLFGQLLSGNCLEQINAAINGMAGASDPEGLKEKLAQLEEISDEKLRAAARLMTMCACYIRLNNLLGVQQESLAMHIAQYIEKNLHDPALSIPSICTKFNISRSTLYTIAKKSFHLGVTDYIRNLRLKRAEEFLRTENIPLYRVAEMVGIPDADYLSKLLKKAVGKSPRQIRKEG